MSSHTELTRGHREDGLLASSPPGRLVPAGHHTHVHAHAPTVQQRVNPHSCTSVRQTQHCMLQQLSIASDGASGTMIWKHALKHQTQTDGRLDTRQHQQAQRTVGWLTLTPQWWHLPWRMLPPAQRRWPHHHTRPLDRPPWEEEGA